MGDLREYRRRRDRRRTPEPVPEPDDPAEPLPRGNDDTFVIQEHHARRLHWDVRLERGGVLVSWAVPRGLPTEPGPKRLAVHTEDHPLDYATFAGEIPAGEYGGGAVTIWDRGSYETRKWTERTVDVTLHGQRARGRYVFFRAGGERDWLVRRMDPPQDPGWEPLPEIPAPMLATPGRLPGSDEDAEFGYEFRWRGQRALLRADGGRVELVDADGADIAQRHPQLRRMGGALGSTQVVLDGELVSLEGSDAPTFLVNDVLHLQGRSCLGLPYAERRELLAGLELRGPAWQTGPWYAGGGAEVLRAGREQGLRGVLAKRLDSPYRPGRRCADWIEVDDTSVRHVVIGGWRPGNDGEVSAVLVGAPADGALRYLGAVRAGFSGPQRRELAARLRRRARRTSPFGPEAPPGGADVRWVTPAVVAEVSYAGWTRRGMLRSPRWRGLRPDLSPADAFG